MIELGNKHESRLTVTGAQTAKTLGSGDLEVLATPAMIALMENAAMLAVAPHLRDNETTVGGYMECSHLRPTGIGEEVRAHAVLRKIEGAALHFDIAAYCGETKLGEGHHVRYVVDRERFMVKVKGSEVRS